MKVAMVAGSVSRQAGGLLPAVQRLSQSLLMSTSAQISVIGLEDEFTVQDSALWKPLKPKTFPVKGPAALGFSPGLRRYLRQNDCDVLHQHGLWQYISVAVSQHHAIHQSPYLISPHGMLDPWALANSHRKKQIAAFVFESKNLRRAACLHALCEAEAQAMRDYGLENPICIIPNGIDPPDELSLEAENGQLPSLLSPLRSSQQKVLLYLGRLHPKKGLINLLHAWAQSKRENGWVLAIAGWDQNGHEDELKSLASKLGLKWTEAGKQDLAANDRNSVIFLGPQFNTAKAACYRNCDAFILPSFSEGLPMVVLESWAYGKPVLMTPQCNLPEGFKANAAIHIAPDTESIAAGLTDLFHLSDADLHLLGKNGRYLVATHFNWDRVASDMGNVYEWVMGKGAKPGCVIS